jgi:hypothetical protein
MAPIIFGAVPATRAMSDSSTSRPRMTCIPR